MQARYCRGWQISRSNSRPTKRMLTTKGVGRPRGSAGPVMTKRLQFGAAGATRGRPRDGREGSHDRIEHSHVTRGACDSYGTRPASPTWTRAGVPAQRASLRAGRMGRACRGAEQARGCCRVRGLRPLNLGDQQQRRIVITNTVEWLTHLPKRRAVPARPRKRSRTTHGHTRPHALELPPTPPCAGSAAS